MILRESAKMIDYFSVAMCFCFDRNGRIWMLQKRKDHEFYPELWGIPGGKIRPKEKPFEAMLREIKEETGNDFPQESIELFLITNHRHRHKGSTIYFKLYTFASRSIFEKIILDKNEHAHYLPVSPENLFKADKRKILIPDTKEIYEMVVKIMK